MKIPALIFSLLLAGSPVLAQNKAAADSLVNLGVEAHDAEKLCAGAGMVRRGPENKTATTCMHWWKKRLP